MRTGTEQPSLRQCMADTVHPAHLEVVDPSASDAETVLAENETRATAALPVATMSS